MSVLEVPCLVAEGEASMRSRPSKKAVRVVILVIVILVLLALPFWLGTGPVLLSP